MVSVGQELLNVPFGEMIKEMALAIAEGQMALDMNSVQVAQALAGTKLDAGSVVMYIEETTDADGNVTASDVVTNDQPMSLLTYGLEPRFYEFTESIIEVKMTITMMRESSTELTYGSEFKLTNESKVTGSMESGGLAKLLFGKSKGSIENTTTVAYTSTFNAKYSSKYSFKEEGTSLLRTTLRPVPAPERTIPRVTVKLAAPASPN
ncbi:MAG: hypothetical protein Q4Q27_06890 [Methanosarcina mazei]|nr:hypothetical protein [Methanosarcina mazei]MDO5839841.1 hypothetical protein [Methanosarcina mazei]WIM42095.1 hypothetical protein PSF70_11170 [Methanosarcina mazei]WIM45544.1 hypothetical protein PQQ20_11085 [Methanosarcina mazei]